MKSRILWTSLALLAAVVFVAFLLRGPISMRLMRAALEGNLGRDAIAALPDGLHVALCGAGGPFPDAQRSGPCVAVAAGQRLFLVDVGAGAPRNLARLVGWPPQRVDAVLLTHFHSDHIDGLGELALLGWPAAGRTSPLSVYGPPGVGEVVIGLNAAYAPDAGYRTAHHGPQIAPPSGAGMVARPFEMPQPLRETTVWDADGLLVRAFRVDHAPIYPAVGYRFDYGGRSVLVSGDTKRSGELERMAHGVDLLVHEALSRELLGVLHDAAQTAGQANIVQITEDVLDYHTTPVEAAEIAQAAGAGHLLLYHIVPPLPIPGLASVFLDGVDDAYDGGVTLGVDGSRVSLPAGTSDIELGR